MVYFSHQCSNTPVSCAQEFLSQKTTLTTLDHCEYSPDLAAANFYLFSPIKSALKGRRFCDANDIIKNATEELKRLPQNDFQECFEHRYCGWQKCV